MDDLVNATNSYRSLKIRVTKQSQEIEAWQSKMEIMKRENGKALKENSLLHMELIKKDEACDERLRAAAAEQRKLEDQIAELHFWKQQQIERHLELEKNHEGVKQKLNDVITGSYAFSKVPGEDIKARMELTEALKEAVAGGPGAAGMQSRAEQLIAVADERAAALQRRLVEAEAEMQRMQSEVDAAKGAVESREGEVRRLHGLLDNAVDVDALAMKELAENKDSLIESLSKQAEDLNRRIIELESTERGVEAAVARVEAGGAEGLSEAELRARLDALVSQLAAAEAKLNAREVDDGQALAAAMSEAAALRRELVEVAAARDDAEAAVAAMKNAGGTIATSPANAAVPASPANAAEGTDERLVEAETARAAAELRAVESAAEARRAQNLLMEAMRELDRVRAFAEQSEEQRGEVIAAAKSAAEVLARHEAASGEQAAALEALDERARAAEAESHRLGRLLMEAAEEREQLIQELRSESEAKARANAAVAAASDPAAPVNAARDEVVARLTRDLEESAPR